MSSNVAPHPDGTLNKTTRMKIRDYRQIYVDSPDPIVFLTVSVNTSGRFYEDFTRLFFLDTHREGSILSRELPDSHIPNVQIPLSRNLIIFISFDFHTWLILKAL